MLLMIQLTIGSVCLIRGAESGNQKIDGGGGRLMDRGEGTGPGVLVPVCVFSLVFLYTSLLFIVFFVVYIWEPLLHTLLDECPYGVYTSPIRMK